MDAATSNPTSSIKELLLGNASSAGDGLARLDKGIRRFAVREPVIAVVGALFLGYVVGRIASKV